MEFMIIINELFDNAMAASNGDLLREKLEIIFNSNENATIILDFLDIELYATPFFNRSTGYFFIKFGGEEIYNSKIKVINLDTLGTETYEYSLETARQLLAKKISEQSISNILKNEDEEE